MAPDVYMDDIADVIYKNFNILFTNNIIKIVKIFVSTSGNILQLLTFFLFRENSQHYMLSNPDFESIPLQNYKREIFPENYVSIAWNCHNLIDSSIFRSNFQHPTIDFYRETFIFNKNKSQEILPTNMLASSVNIYSFGA